MFTIGNKVRCSDFIVIGEVKSSRKVSEQLDHNIVWFRGVPLDGRMDISGSPVKRSLVLLSLLIESR